MEINIHIIWWAYGIYRNLLLPGRSVHRRLIAASSLRYPKKMKINEQNLLQELIISYAFKIHNELAKHNLKYHVMGLHSAKTTYKHHKYSIIVLIKHMAITLSDGLLRANSDH